MKKGTSLPRPCRVRKRSLPTTLNRCSARSFLSIFIASWPGIARPVKPIQSLAAPPIKIAMPKILAIARIRLSALIISASLMKRKSICRSFLRGCFTYFFKSFVPFCLFSEEGVEGVQWEVIAVYQIALADHFRSKLTNKSVGSANRNPKELNLVASMGFV